MRERCEDCRYFYDGGKITEHVLKGEHDRHLTTTTRMVSCCRRHAPISIDGNEIGLTAANWPLVAKEDGCGDHEPVTPGIDT